MIRYAQLDDARAAVELFGGNLQSVELLGHSGNSVFKFVGTDGQSKCLRFTDPEFRTLEEVQGELEFLEHLRAKNAPSCYAIRSRDGSLAQTLHTKGGPLIISATTYIPGIHVDESSPHWNKDMFKEWGRNLTQLHMASSTYQASESKRWLWSDEILFRRASDLIPADDTQSREEFSEVMGRVAQLPRTNENFGMIHADHGPQNFAFNANSGKIAAFDFGNCCYHWYLADVAISLSTIRRKSNREEIRAALLEGYNESMPLPPDYAEQIELFIRLRVLYVYLSRLHKFSPIPSADQTEVLKQLKSLVHARKGW
jgi:amicoumacin kinase